MKKKLKRVEGRDHLYRTPEGAIINTDDNAYRAYKQRKLSSKRKDDEVKGLCEQLNDAKEEIQELKEMIRKLLDAK